ncbi:hypothetical protein [Burkholderia sp. RS02]|uniref:hypothetical protein n=1 Tax=unclassified Burkholderia TaxID=2613784 RepID=UPI0032181214
MRYARIGGFQVVVPFAASCAGSCVEANPNRSRTALATQKAREWVLYRSSHKYRITMILMI